MQARSRERQRLTPSRITLFAAVALAACVSDLATKWRAFRPIAQGTRILGEEIPVIRGFFYLRTSYNTGGVFGSLQGRTTFFIVFSLLAIAFILWFFWQQGYQDRILTVGLGLLMGGALGNLHDRVLLRRVRDFLDFRIAGWSYPTFNLADTAICVGVGLLLISSFLWREPEAEQPDAEAATKSGS
jgi:signal peptidase II